MRSKDLETKLSEQDKALRELRKENRALRSKIKEVSSGRTSWKEKFLKNKNDSFVKKQRDISVIYGVSGIDGHKYDEVLVDMCVNIYVLGRSGFRGVTKILTYLNKALSWGLKELPCKSSVENWVQKAGCHLYETVDEEKYKDGYGIILDECMVVGQERMLAVLGVASTKTGAQALGLADVDVLGLHVKPSWTGESIGKALSGLTKKMGKAPAYVISDGASNLKNGIELAGLPRIYDSGHHIALLIEHTYKGTAEFESLSKEMALCKFKEVMKPTAYLLPPKQRTIARFMNLSTTVKWAKKMLGVQSSLNKEEQKAYGFLNNHIPIIGELSSVFELVNGLLQILKQQGLSHATVVACMDKFTYYKGCVYPKMQQLINKIKDYLETEKQKLPDSKTTWHVSSDILESIFGLYKSRKASNALHGITPFVLTLPVFTKIDSENNVVNINLKQALESVSMANLKQWNVNNLIENQIVRRNKMLKNQPIF
jgi:hypothetical protein